jgi:hypothetical protein
MQLSEGERLENQHVQRSLQQIGFVIWHFGLLDVDT